MMRKFMLATLSCLAVLTGCVKDPEEQNKPAEADIIGIWELSSVATKASVGSVTVNVYLEFETGVSFTLYQKIGDGRYTKFTGSYSLDKNTCSLSGSYADGAAWGPYAVEQEGTMLKLTSPGGKEVDTYKKIDILPSSVTDNLY